MKNKIKQIKIIKYRTAKQCLAAFHGCKLSEVVSNAMWKFYDGNGKCIHWSQKRCLASIYRRGCWGWCENKRILHLWISNKSKIADAISLIAHEMGHCVKPYLSAKNEEIKASKYEDVTWYAVDAYLKLKHGG